MLTRLHRADVVADAILGGGARIQAAARALQGGRARRARLSAGRHRRRAVQKLDDAECAIRKRARQQQWREIGLGAQILRDLGVSSIVNLSSTPRSYVGLGGFGIEIAGTEPLEG